MNRSYRLHFHSAKFTGHSRLSQQRRRRELGKLRVRSRKSPADHEYQSPAHLCKLIPREELDAARKGASTWIGSTRIRAPDRRSVRNVPNALLSSSGLPCTPHRGAMSQLWISSPGKNPGTLRWAASSQRLHGTVNLGGPIVTAGGLVFTASAMDNFIRAFDSESGKELWKFELPRAANRLHDLHAQRQAISSHRRRCHGKLGTKQGDSVLAFTLP